MPRSFNNRTIWFPVPFILMVKQQGVERSWFFLGSATFKWPNNLLLWELIRNFLSINFVDFLTLNNTGVLTGNREWGRYTVFIDSMIYNISILHQPIVEWSLESVPSLRYKWSCKLDTWHRLVSRVTMMWLELADWTGTAKIEPQEASTPVRLYKKVQEGQSSNIHNLPEAERDSILCNVTGIIGRQQY